MADQNRRMIPINVVAGPLSDRPDSTQYERTIYYAEDVDQFFISGAGGGWRQILESLSVQVGGVPAGVIVMWSGVVALIPLGWALCDGTNGTPDLRGRFILGATVAGTTGGGATHAHAAHADHAVTQPAAHASHTVTQPAAHPGPAAHAHELPFQKLAGATGALRMLDPAIFGTGTARAALSVSANPTGNTTSAAVLKSEGVVAGGSLAHTGGAVDAHSAHTGAAVSAHSGHDTASNTPPYYALCFIMKL